MGDVRLCSGRFAVNYITLNGYLIQTSFFIPEGNQIYSFFFALRINAKIKINDLHTSRKGVFR